MAIIRLSSIYKKRWRKIRKGGKESYGKKWITKVCENETHYDFLRLLETSFSKSQNKSSMLHPRKTWNTQTIFKTDKIPR